MSSPTPGSDPNHPQGGPPQGQPGWNAPQAPDQGYGQQYGQGAGQQYGQGAGQGYGGPAPSYSGAPAGYGGGPQRPGMVTAAGVIGIVWGALGLLFGLIGLAVAFAFGAIYGLLLLISVAISGALLWAGIQVVQNKSPRLLLLISYVAIGVNLLTMIWAMTEGASIFSGLLGFVLPGIVVFLLLNPQSKQYYASRGISY